MTFTEQQRNWEGLAETDPLWAVLSEPEKRGNKWDVLEFYDSGVEEVVDVRTHLFFLDLELKLDGVMLDVGCGPGRVTHAFAEHFEEVVGYDISDRMLDLARRDARPNEEYILNETDDLSPFGDEEFDFVYCNKVLQHVDMDQVGNYMAEMGRVLRPAGVLFLQMLSHRTGWPGTKESDPDPEWSKNGGPPPHYTVCSARIDFMMKAFIEMDLIIHQARLVEKGEGQSIFSYEFVVSKR